MTGKKIKKGTRGEVAKYISRNSALKKLMLGLKDFRRLCILKGVYPREPKNRKKVQGGSTVQRCLYQVKDIRFLMHEPIIWRFREMSAFMKKIKKAIHRNEKQRVERMDENSPKYNIDHIVKERYPTFIDAIRDLEDCLCLLFLFATFPTMGKKVPNQMIRLCQRLSIEFQHYVIEARALRKVFCSIKGYYFQADIKGQTVTWVMPHCVPFSHACEDVDLKVMAIFTEFYTTMLGFINFRLYNSINLTYPPKLAGMVESNADIAEDENTRVYALNRALHRVIIAEDVEKPDDIPMYDDDEKMEEAKKEQKAVESQRKLFEGLKFFINREVPRESLVFMIRCFGGEVSWDSNCAPGATYKEGDERITHHIADRPNIANKKLGRFYVQPQWIFDSINRRIKLNEKDYALGETLPPHLSPFVEGWRREGDYIPPEEKAILAEASQDSSVMEDGGNENVEENDEENESGEEMEEGEEGDSENDSEEGEEDSETETEKVEEVKIGTKAILDKAKLKEQQEKEEYRLREMLIPNKQRRLYHKIMKTRKRNAWEARKMTAKREQWEKDNAETKKKEKAAKKAAAKETAASVAAAE